jgi:hypothetical protein
MRAIAATTVLCLPCLIFASRCLVDEGALTLVSWYSSGQAYKDKAMKIDKEYKYMQEWDIQTAQSYPSALFQAW